MYAIAQHENTYYVEEPYADHVATNYVVCTRKLQQTSCVCVLIS